MNRNQEPDVGGLRAVRFDPADELSHPDSVLLTPDEVGQRLRLSRARIYELTASGDLRSVKIGRSRRVPLTAITDFIASCQS